MIIFVVLRRHWDQDYIRSFVFGCQDALVSTSGVIVGVGTAIANRQYILLSATITILVEAISMAAGQYLSEKSVHDLPHNRHRDNLIYGSLIMLISYLFGGFIPLVPVFFAPINLILPLSIIFAFLGLLTLGYLKGVLFTTHPIKSSLEVLLVGGLAVLIGLTVGFFFRIGSN